MVEVANIQSLENGQHIIRFSLGNTALPAVIAAIEKGGAVLESIERYKLSLHDVFVQLTTDVHAV
jgi:hypothetical protein